MAYNIHQRVVAQLLYATEAYLFVNESVFRGRLSRCQMLEIVTLAERIPH